MFSELLKLSISTLTLPNPFIEGSQFVLSDKRLDVSHTPISVAKSTKLLSFGLKGIGLSIKMHYSNLNIDDEHADKYTGNSIVLDLGWSSFVYYSDNHKVRFALKAENIINSYLNWDID